MRFTLAFLLAAPLAALGESPFTSLHPEEAYPDPQPRVSQHAYTGLVVGMQERLNALGFDAGPPNGDFGAKTQAALAQFQLSRAIPASGQLDDPTLAELGLQRTPTDAAAGASAPQQSEAPPPQAPQPAASPEPATAASPPAKPGS
jgi:peptidoglycan hydrolase-like protein with peptidoglycan-binding domain